MQVIARRAKSGIYVNGGIGGVEAMSFFARFGLPLENRQIFEAVEVRKIHEIKAAEMAASRATDKTLPGCAISLTGPKTVCAMARDWISWTRSFILKSSAPRRTRSS